MLCLCRLLGLTSGSSDLTSIYLFFFVSRFYQTSHSCWKNYMSGRRPVLYLAGCCRQPFSSPQLRHTNDLHRLSYGFSIFSNVHSMKKEKEKKKGILMRLVSSAFQFATSCSGLMAVQTAVSVITKQGSSCAAEEGRRGGGREEGGLKAGAELVWKRESGSLTKPLGAFAAFTVCPFLCTCCSFDTFPQWSEASFSLCVSLPLLTRPQRSAMIQFH